MLGTLLVLYIRKHARTRKIQVKPSNEDRSKLKKYTLAEEDVVAHREEAVHAEEVGEEDEMEMDNLPLNFDPLTLRTLSA